MWWQRSREYRKIQRLCAQTNFFHKINFTSEFGAKKKKKQIRSGICLWLYRFILRFDPKDWQDVFALIMREIDEVNDGDTDQTQDPAAQDQTDPSGRGIQSAHPKAKQDQASKDHKALHH